MSVIMPKEDNKEDEDSKDKPDGDSKGKLDSNADKPDSRQSLRTYLDLELVILLSAIFQVANVPVP